MNSSTLPPKITFVSSSSVKTSILGRASKCLKHYGNLLLLAVWQESDLHRQPAWFKRFLWKLGLGPIVRFDKITTPSFARCISTEFIQVAGVLCIQRTYDDLDMCMLQRYDYNMRQALLSSPLKK